MLRPLTRTVAVTLARVGALVATLTMAACSSSASGQVALAVDPAGRLVAIVAVCGGQDLKSLTLTDQVTGTATTARPPTSVAPGGTIILTPPITQPRIEGVLDLLDRDHTYLLTGQLASDQSTGTMLTLNFKLDDVVSDQKLRHGSVLAAHGNTTAVIDKDAFVTRAKDSC